ncbi:MAG TPA: serine hydrolase domain-containing protein [Pseudomonadales bacterium]|nr:serine hydrolase domain-containing protein [Pseudomonadales bacterium]
MLDGTVHPDYADVASVLIRQIPRNSPGGSAVCVYHDSRKVVDLWGGTRDRDNAPWTADTTAPSFSTTKGVISTLVHILVDKGRARYDDPIAKYWPEFAANGKGNITIRQALCHEAGLYRIDEMITRSDEILDWQHMKALVAAARPVHEPGERHGYHALTYGWLIGGVIEAVTGKPLQRVLQEELVDPLQLDGMFIGMPHNELYRRAKLIARDGISTPLAETDGWSDSLREWIEAGLAKLGIEFSEFRAAMGLNEPFDWNAEATVQAIIPAANGQFTARSLARMYAMIANGGELDGVRLLSEARVREMSQVHSKKRDRVVFLPMHWRMGYHRAFSLGASAPSAFGHYGFGGSGAFCDPARRLSVALTVNSGVGSPFGDVRMPRIARAAIKAVDRLRA